MGCVSKGNLRPSRRGPSPPTRLRLSGGWDLSLDRGPGQFVESDHAADAARRYAPHTPQEALDVPAVLPQPGARHADLQDNDRLNPAAVAPDRMQCGPVR